MFKHIKLAEHVSLSGANGEDAENYEEKDVGKAIQTRGKPSDRYPVFVSWSDKQPGVHWLLSTAREIG